MLHQKVFLENKNQSSLSMAHLHSSHSIAFKGSREIRPTKIPFHNLRMKKITRSSDQKVSLESEKQLEPNRTCRQEISHWQVRRMVETEDEMRQVANVQAQAFHKPAFLFDDVFFESFKAKVLSGLLYSLRNSNPDRYACLVAEPGSDYPISNKDLVGVVDVTVQSECSVTQHLTGAEEYLYVSGIAVLDKFRRQKVATALLKACDSLSAIWGFEYLVLRAYEDDYGAQKLYSNSGYRIVSGDAPWTTSWVGRRRRIVMVKKLKIQ